jgi:cobalamin biosynthesis protein CobD/CbiB
LAYAYDRLFNASRLLKGESTANIEHAHHHQANLDEVEARIAELEGRDTAGMSEEQVIDAEIAQLEEDLDKE